MTEQPTPETPDHGPRLTVEEFNRRITALYSEAPASPSRDQAADLRRKELDVTIDFRLGTEFPAARRDALWAVQQRLRGSPVTFLVRAMLGRLFARSLERGAKGRARHVVKAYEDVLSPEELELFFGREEAEDPSLPIDRAPR